MDSSRVSMTKASEIMAEISSTLDSLLTVSYTSMEKSMSHEEFAKINLNLAYALNVLYYSISIEDHRFVEK